MDRSVVRICAIMCVLAGFVGVLVRNIPREGEMVVPVKATDEISVVTQGEQSLISQLLNGGGDLDYSIEIGGEGEGDEEEDGQLYITDPLRYELDSWTQLVDIKLNHTLSNLQNDVERQVTQEIQVLNDTMWTSILNQISRIHSQDMKTIQKHIHDIKCIGKWNKDTNEMEYYDLSGQNKITQYVTRPLLDTLITRSLTTLNESYTDAIHVVNDTFPVEFNNLVKEILQIHVAMFEEWGESVFTEWSERMANNDILLDSESIPLPYWRQFLSTKEKVIQIHDQLIIIKPTDMMSTVDQFLKSCQRDLNTLFTQCENDLFQLMEQASRQFTLRDQRETTPPLN